MEHKNIYQLVLAGVLCAIGLVVPMVMPKVIIGPMSFTLGAHAAIFLAMFISPKVAAAVCLGTTMGFFVTTPLIIAARAATHIIFALVGALIIRRYPNIMESFVAGIGLNLDERMNAYLQKSEDYESKGFMDAVRITDFPIRDHKVILVLRRRRWKNKETGETFVDRISVTESGTRYSKEFAAFLKETYGHIPDDLPYA